MQSTLASDADPTRTPTNLKTALWVADTSGVGWFADGEGIMRTRGAAVRLALVTIVGLTIGATPTSASAIETPLRVVSENQAATPLSGTATDGGVSIQWAITGATPRPNGFDPAYDGIVAAGATVTLTGTMQVTNPGPNNGGCIMSANLTSAWDGKERKVSRVETVTPGTHSLPFSLSVVAPQAWPSAQPGEAFTEIYVNVTSQFSNWADSSLSSQVSRRLTLAVMKQGSVSPADPLKVSLTTRKGIYVETPARKLRRYSNISRFPLKLTYKVTGGSGRAESTLGLFSGGQLIRKVRTNGFVKNGTYTWKIVKTPSGSGPFYWCVLAKDDQGTESNVDCRWVAIAVPQSRANVNGCGTGEYGAVAEWLQNRLGDSRTYTEAGQESVSVRLACNNHDAGYSGIATYDKLNKVYVDYRKWSRYKVDNKFLADVRTLCSRGLETDENVAVCSGGLGLADFKRLFLANPIAALGQAGATTYFEIVRAYGAVGFDANAARTGIQNEMPGETLPVGAARDNT